MKKLVALTLLLLLVATLTAQVKIGGTAKVGGTARSGVAAGGGGGGPTASDDFNRADAFSLGANWTSQVPFECEIISNEASGESGTCYGMWVGAGTFTDDQYSQITITTHLVAQPSNAAVRLSGTTFGTIKGYFCGATRDTGVTDDRYKIWLMNADATPTQVAAVTGGTPAVTSGDVIKLSITFSGGVNTLTCSRNGSPLTGLTGVTDSTIGTGGKPGFVIAASTGRADDWSAGAP